MHALRKAWLPAGDILTAFLSGRAVVYTECAAADCAAIHPPTMWPDLFHRHCCAGPTFARFLLEVIALLAGAAVLWASVQLASRRLTA